MYLKVLTAANSQDIHSFILPKAPLSQIPNLSSTENYRCRTYLILVPNLSDTGTKLIRYQLIKDRTYQISNLIDTELLSDTELIRYRTYQIQNLSDTELFRYRTYHIQNLSDAKLIKY